MQIFQAFLYCNLLFLLISCSSKRDNSDRFTDSVQMLHFQNIYNHEVANKNVDRLSQIRKVICLDNAEDLPLIELTSNYTLDERYVFLYSKELGSICAYSHEGTFLGFIGIKGKGPGEFLNADQVIADNNLYVNDRMGKKVNVYDMSKRSFERSISYQSSAYEMNFFDGHMIFYTPYRTSHTLYEILDDESNSFKGVIGKDKCYETMDFYGGLVITEFRDTRLLLDYITGKVYSLDKSNFEPRLKYIINLDAMLPKDDCVATDYLITNSGDLQIRFPTEFVETSSHFVISIMDKKFASNKIIQTKSTGNYVITGSQIMSESFSNILPFFPAKKIFGKYFAAIVDFHYLYNVCGLDSVKIPKELSDLSPDGNPAIIIYELLDF